MSKTAKVNTDIAQNWDEKRKRAVWAIIGLTALTVVIVTALSLLDWTLFDPILTRYNYEASEFTNIVLCAALALLTLILAVPMSTFLRKCLNKRTRTAQTALILAILLVAEVVFLVFAWRVRAQQYASNEDLGNLFNGLQVAFVVVVLVIHMIIDKAKDRQKARRDVCETERDYHNFLNYFSRFETTSAQDRTRRNSDFRALCAAADGLVQKLIDAMKSARSVIARHVAEDSEDVDAIMRTPYLLGNKEIADDHEAEAEIRKLTKAPCTNDFHEVYGAPINGSHLDARVEKDADEFEQRHHEIVSICPVAF